MCQECHDPVVFGHTECELAPEYRYVMAQHRRRMADLARQEMAEQHAPAIPAGDGRPFPKWQSCAINKRRHWCRR